MVKSLGTLLFLALIFVIVYEQVFWVTNFQIWDKPNDPNAMVATQWIRSIDATFNHWSYWLNSKYLSSWIHVFYFASIMFLYKIILFKFILSFITDSLRASNAVIVPADQNIKLQHLAITIETLRFLKCMKKKHNIYPKDVKDSSRNLDNLFEPVDWTTGYYRDDEWLNKEKSAEPGDQYLYCVFEKAEKPIEVEKKDPIQVLRDNVLVSLDGIYNRMELMELKVNNKDLDEILESTKKS